MRDLLIKNLSALVADPAALSVQQLNGEKTLIFELRCAKDDVGKIIGKSGKTITALRALMNAVALTQTGQRVVIEVAE